jgi:hypothetical protein
MIALSTSVMIATLVAGLAIAQDEELPAGGEETSGEAAETTGATGATDATGEGGEFADPAATEGASGDPGAAAAAAVGEGAEGETATSAEADTGDSGMDAGTYAVRLRDLEQRINELKEQIFRSKARLSLLAETVLQGVVAGAQAVIVHENRMSSSYRLVKAVYALDGARIFSKADEEGSLGERQELDIYDGSIVPGEHTLTVNLEYRGHGYGIFSYLKGYRFRVRSNYSFTAPEGKAITIRVVGYEKGGPTAPLEERPAIRYIERLQQAQRGEAEVEGAGASGESGEE